MLDDAACAALLDHVSATLTSDRALRMRYFEEIGRRGSRRIAQQLATQVPGAASVPERLLATGLQAAGLTGFLVNESVLGYVADFLDPARRLILEVDGYRTHGTWIAVQDDRTRQNVLVTHGYTVLRYTAHDIQTRLEAILREIAMVIATMPHDRRKRKPVLRTRCDGGGTMRSRRARTWSRWLRGSAVAGPARPRTSSRSGPRDR